MIRSRVGVRVVVFALLAGMAHPAAADTPTVKAAGPPTLAVVDFDGSNRDLSRSLTETVWTELAQSDRIQVVTCGQTRHVMAIVAPKGIDQLDDGAVKHIGRALHADRVVVGSYMLRDGSLLINARVLDTSTGRMIRGGACAAGGGGKELQSVCRSLAGDVLQKVAVANPPAAVPGGEGGGQDPDEPALHPVTPAVPAGVDSTQSVVADPSAASAMDELSELKGAGVIPAGVPLGKTLAERDLQTLIRSVHKHALTEATMPAIELTGQPVTRLRVLVGLVKAILPAGEIPTAGDVGEGDLPTDGADIPGWARGYVLAATQQGWFAATSPLQGAEPANWRFVASILVHVPMNLDVQAAPDVSTSGTASDETYTGLVIDARDLPKFGRSPVPHVRDEEDRVIYPVDGHIPSDSFVEDKGMVSYDADPTEARRAGSHPLVVKALRVSGPGNDDLVVSDQDAELIRRANLRTKFLWRWSVSFVGGIQSASSGSASADTGSSTGSSGGSGSTGGP
jgi:TolB-like protein